LASKQHLPKAELERGKYGRSAARNGKSEPLGRSGEECAERADFAMRELAASSSSAMRCRASVSGIADCAVRRRRLLKIFPLRGFEVAINRDYPIKFGTLYVFTLIGLLLKLLSDLTTWSLTPASTLPGLNSAARSGTLAVFAVLP
jgi:hypothetical protein